MINLATSPRFLFLKILVGITWLVGIMLRSENHMADFSNYQLETSGLPGSRKSCKRAKYRGGEIVRVYPPIWYLEIFKGRFSFSQATESTGYLDIYFL